jgi:hypothetical protein
VKDRDPSLYLTHVPESIDLVRVCVADGIVRS